MGKGISEVNLYHVGKVTAFYGTGGGPHYNPLCWQTTDSNELIDKICNFMERESEKNLILRTLVHEDPVFSYTYPTKFSKFQLENIKQDLEKKGLKVKLAFN